MSTRSNICIEREDGKYETIYCHSDGYLTYNGAMLLDHYSDREKIEKLIKLGDISCLNINVDPDPSKPHSFDYDKRQEDVVVAYGRDRGEKDVESKLLTMDILTDDSSWIEYVYIFDKNGKWKYMELPDTEIRDVEEDLKKEYEKMGIKRPKDFYGYWTDDTIAREKFRQKRHQSEDEM